MSVVLARAAISLNEYFSVTQIDAAIIGFVGLMVWWWLPSKRPQPPAPGQPERLERMADRIDALVAGTHQPHALTAPDGNPSLTPLSLRISRVWWWWWRWWWCVQVCCWLC